ncbi:MAG: HAD-IA family hydrolase [Deltaproteobacteria bacterium]|nr:HAD-IA family hydrolase [Deltaproteobacteria bacterium]
MPFAAVIFDLDGTLVDSSRDLADAVNRALTEQGLPARSHEEIRAFVGDGARRLIDRSLPEDQLALAPDTLARFQAHYGRGLLASTRPYPGVVEVLEALAPRPLAVATNKPEGFSRAILAGLHLDRFFAVVVGGDSLAVRKPDPQVLFEVARRLGVEVEATLYVGDGLQDVLAARRAGMACGAVSWGFCSVEALLAAGAELVFEAPREILDVVRAATLPPRP